MQMVKWELFNNVKFRIGSSLFDQKAGVPIGGPMSAQLASAYCIACEIVFLKHGPPRSLFHTPARFRDNVILLALRDVSNMELLQLFHAIYCLDFTVEQSGCTLTSLEAHLRWVVNDLQCFTHFQLLWKLTQPVKPPRPEMQIQKWLDHYSLNAKYFVKSFTPAACQKCLYYSLSEEDALKNLLALETLYTEHMYPAKWWKRYWTQMTQKTRKGEG